MLYLGNSAVQAISLLISKGVPESNIIFLNLISVSDEILQWILFPLHLKFPSHKSSLHFKCILMLLNFFFQAPQGVHVVCKRFPRIKIVTSEIEIGLNSDFRVVPGMGEFVDRYFGTDDDDQPVKAAPMQ